MHADVDFAEWKDTLSDDPDAEFILYDGLNHLFIASDGPYMSTAQEYYDRGHVEQRVIDDIAGFILDRPSDVCLQAASPPTF